MRTAITAIFLVLLSSYSWGADFAYRYPSGTPVEINTGGVSANPTSGSVPVNSSGSFVDSAIYQSGSYVGINNVTPAQALDVTGNVNASGTVAAAGFSSTGSGAGTMAASGGFSIDPANNTYTSGADFISSTGNIGIGSSAPEARLKIVGAGTGTAHAIDVVDSALASKFVVTDQGYVGIGSTSPSTPLCVGTTCQFNVTGSGGATIGNGTTTPSITGSASSTTLTMVIKQTSANASSGGIQFQTGNNGAIKPITILTGGNVGIMTTSPSDSMEIDGNLYIKGTGFKLKMLSPDGTLWQCQPANITGVLTCS